MPVASHAASGNLSIPWWLWPNVVALDAPAVGMIWQRFFGVVFGISIPIIVTITLGLVIWAVYLTDRWLDAAPHKHHEQSERHRFARKNRLAIGFVVILVWIIAAGFALVCVPWEGLVAGAGIAVSVAGYLALVHFAKRTRLIAHGGKEGIVGLLFAGGVGVPLLARDANQYIDWLPSVAAFAALCWLNCEWISCWERESLRDSAWRGWLALAICLGLTFWVPTIMASAIIPAALFLVLIHGFHDRIGLRLARVLADLALFTPLAFLIS
ncbi:MAG: hypothetical protein U0798_02790 [Gemmataceae bacterium]